MRQQTEPAATSPQGAKRGRGRPPGSVNKHRRGFPIEPTESASTQAPPTPQRPPKPTNVPAPADKAAEEPESGEKQMRGKNWSTQELQALINAWNYCLVHKAGIAEKSAQLQERIFQRFAANCTGECGTTDGSCRRTAKSVGDKIASVRLMYRFIKDFDTHTKIEGSENLPDWYRLDKKARKDFCRKFDRQPFDGSIYEQLTLLFESGGSAEMHHNYPRPPAHWRPAPFPQPPFRQIVPQQTDERAPKKARMNNPAPIAPPPTSIAPGPDYNNAGIHHLANIVQQQNQALVKMVQDWREVDRQEREKQRQAEAEERAKDRSNMLESMKMMLEALKPAKK